MLRDHSIASERYRWFADERPEKTVGSDRQHRVVSDLGRGPPPTLDVQRASHSS
jgi:hypothetical protein